MPLDLPIFSILNSLVSALKAHKNVILTATPGAGKSTVVPLHLLEKLSPSNAKIVLVQPRRLAVKSVANRLSASINEKTGKTVGYRMRMDTRISQETQIEVVTTGVLLRAIQEDPELTGVGLVIFDEVHERSLTCDLCMSLCVDIQQGLREDLQLLAMSATVDASVFTGFLPDSTVISCDAPMFPVDVHYRPSQRFTPETSDYFRVTLDAHRQHSGSILVFLPGIREIRQLETQLLDASLCNTEIVCLYGGLTIKDQQAAIQAPKDPNRKIVLATSIAETSLTIEGITVVIDGGQNRYQEYNSATGMNGMCTGKNAMAGADQRTGRAGRLGPGTCYRLWAESERREAHNTPEILIADLVPTALNLSEWGVTDESDLRWLTSPPEKTLQNARELLTDIDAIDAKHCITETGKKIQALGLHPRIGKMLSLTSGTASFREACLVATVLNESGSSHLGYRGDDLEQLLRFCQSPSFTRTARGAQLTRLTQKLYNSGTIKKQGRHFSIGEMLALAYPDRVAQKRKGSRENYKMANGRGAVLKQSSSLVNSPYIVISELSARTGDAIIFQAASISLESIEQLFTKSIKQHDSVSLDESTGVFTAELQSRLGALVLSSKKMNTPDKSSRSLAICQYIRGKGLAALNWSDDCKTWQARINIIKKNFAGSWPNTVSALPDVDDDDLLLTLEQWLAPWLVDISTIRALQKLDLRPLLNNLLDWPQSQFVEKQAPTHYKVASGSKIRLSYIDNDMPVLAARIQELFSTRVNPSICDGRQALLIHLLSPGRRPVQITSDLAGFWQSSYEEVKKEMKGRYPKHHWPDDPANTAPHSSIRPK